MKDLFSMIKNPKLSIGYLKEYEITHAVLRLVHGKMDCYPLWWKRSM